MPVWVLLMTISLSNLKSPFGLRGLPHLAASAVRHSSTRQTMKACKGVTGKRRFWPQRAIMVARSLACTLDSRRLGRMDSGPGRWSCLPVSTRYEVRIASFRWVSDTDRSVDTLDSSELSVVGPQKTYDRAQMVPVPGDSRILTRYLFRRNVVGECVCLMLVHCQSTT
ncbi:uncharacterized protein BDZ83DRAFT_167690 [Colletotrichum acutatum]|uniref:Uncharacterized protein n=1 Tax=Glomerella acutata TaxID=27357 RepID=A0AAD8XQ52_GLOAC|nr:uncharacterized protein BDZ83DRAFT_167690 [Colletotrichum acutatum]KAK1731645.1 hypothetical protein BDZ83DRAFT_167690 [Colletotrichum acutatum]